MCIFYVFKDLINVFKNTIFVSNNKKSVLLNNNTV